MSKEAGFERELFSVTTIIITNTIKNGNMHTGQGTGFFYNEITPADPTKKGAQWHRIDKYWLITNRHVVLPKIDNTECVPDQVVFGIRRLINDGIDWEFICIKKAELLQLLKLHSDPTVDVAAVDVSGLIHQAIKKELEKTPGQCNLLVPATLTAANLPQNQPIDINVTSDIVVASYPKGFYDTVNKFPIVKSGIIASAWGYNFRGCPMFEIDAQLFPGSSGGLVISKPTQFTIIGGAPHYSAKKQFVLLGVYSGEYTWRDTIEVDGKKIAITKSYGLGNVWYSYLIPEIITKGTGYAQ